MLRRLGVSARPVLLTADMKGIVTRLGRRSFSVGGRAETLAAQSGIAQRRRIEPDGAPFFARWHAHFSDRLAGFASPRIWAILKPAGFYVYFAWSRGRIQNDR